MQTEHKTNKIHVIVLLMYSHFTTDKVSLKKSKNSEIQHNSKLIHGRLKR